MAKETAYDLAKKWLDLDHDSDTRKEIQDLVDAHDELELDQRLRQRIAFGTAGLRSSMKAGFAHINAYTVLQTSEGLANYILQQHGPILNKERSLKVIIGYDARHNSERFARLAAGAFLAKGLQVLWFGQMVHTPMVPFALKLYQAAAGVMVTASHNPKADNGYKVYWSNGSQIIPPHDQGIADAIGNVQAITNWDERMVDCSPFVQHIWADASESYVSSVHRLAQPPKTSSPLSFTYTPMHGVGLSYMQKVSKFPEFCNITMNIVEIQAQPDPDFPTVPFPNPEEKNALDIAFVEAARNGSMLVVANDPDADRFAVAQEIEKGRWHQFTGNQVGILLASYVFETHSNDKKKLAMLASTVSSRMLNSMAEKNHFLFKETLTGFKWLGNVAQSLQKQGYEPVFAFEEAIGYMFPSVVWDKDGIAAATVFLSAWQHWRQQAGLTPFQKLEELYATYGFFEDANTYLISPSPDVTERIFTNIRASGSNGAPPSNLGKRKILRWRDLTVGYDSARSDFKPSLPVDKTSQMITCELGDVVFTARGSGTEPKIKLYVEGTASSSAAAKAKAHEVLQDLLKEWFKPEYGLRLAGT